MGNPSVLERIAGLKDPVLVPLVRLVALGPQGVRTGVGTKNQVVGGNRGVVRALGRSPQGRQEKQGSYSPCDLGFV